MYSEKAQPRGESCHLVPPRPRTTTRPCHCIHPHPRAHSRAQPPPSGRAVRHARFHLCWGRRSAALRRTRPAPSRPARRCRPPPARASAAAPPPPPGVCPGLGTAAGPAAQGLVLLGPSAPAPIFGAAWGAPLHPCRPHSSDLHPPISLWKAAPATNPAPGLCFGSCSGHRIPAPLSPRG